MEEEIHHVGESAGVEAGLGVRDRLRPLGGGSREWSEAYDGDRRRQEGEEMVYISDDVHYALTLQIFHLSPSLKNLNLNWNPSLNPSLMMMMTLVQASLGVVP